MKNVTTETTIPNLHSAPLRCSNYDGLDLYSPDPEFATVSSHSHLQSVCAQNSGFIPTLQDYPETSPNIYVDLFGSENQVNFVMDLFRQRVEPNLPSLGLSNLELDLGLELMIFADRHENHNCPVMAADTECRIGSGISGLRVVGIESDSEEDDNEVVGVDENAEEEEDFGLDSDGDDVDIESLLLHWNPFELDEHIYAIEDFDFDWQHVVNRELDASVQGIVLPSHQNMRNSEWEILSNNLNFESNTNPEHYNEYSSDEYELLFGQFAENENAVMGKPPASRTVIENLPSVILTQHDLVNERHILCAVCKDEINLFGEAKQLPCNHRYHSDCIIAWLGIRNTCPVCRHELPTDDLDYERRKDLKNW